MLFHISYTIYYICYMIQKVIFRDQVKSHLLKEIVEGNIKPGEAISLAQFSRNLEVSVTPIREALSQLQQIGIVEVIPNRGFRLPSLTLKEAKEIYPIIARMESWAVNEGEFTEARMQKLVVANENFLNAEKPMDAVLADEKFHSYLIEGCTNETLIRMIKDLKVKVLIYEIEFMKRKNYTEQSNEEHNQIIQALINHDKEAAIEILLTNWQGSLDFISKYFHENT